MDLDPLREKALAAMTATTAQDGATAFGLHAGTEAELAFARALGRLVGALHVVKVLKDSGRRECPEGRGVSMDDLNNNQFHEILLPRRRFHPSFSHSSRKPSWFF